ncbi:hypothetical protein LY632_11390 [Erythrobacter sp. SDW2]|uniref:hypothetical protein n=1 Tax=Erythrobacter sp. SDW2 TaxID=2907154 RepID=UPI001F1924AA|nr:hypothetical protein [Erythrobacter sp. SDW2]UIP06288.1 hypothetical protein LY632_11390 [Erythrobacter sp. SDW2]
MAHTMPLRLASLLLPLPIAACAAPDGGYPSLQIRAAERFDPAAGQAEPLPPAPIPPELLAQVARLKAEAAAADAAFQRLLPAATAAAQAARGAAVASDRWADAQVAIAGLDMQRSETASALADLEILYAARALALETRDEIDDARQAVASIVAGQDATLVRLKGIIE